MTARFILNNNATVTLTKSLPSLRQQADSVELLQCETGVVICRSTTTKKFAPVPEDYRAQNLIWDRFVCDNIDIEEIMMQTTNETCLLKAKDMEEECGIYHIPAKIWKKFYQIEGNFDRPESADNMDSMRQYAKAYSLDNPSVGESMWSRDDSDLVDWRIHQEMHLVDCGFSYEAINMIEPMVVRAMEIGETIEQLRYDIWDVFMKEEREAWAERYRGDLDEKRAKANEYVGRASLFVKNYFKTVTNITVLRERVMTYAAVAADHGKEYKMSTVQYSSVGRTGCAVIVETTEEDGESPWFGYMKAMLDKLNLKIKNTFGYKWCADKDLYFSFMNWVNRTYWYGVAKARMSDKALAQAKYQITMPAEARTALNKLMYSYKAEWERAHDIHKNHPDVAGLDPDYERERDWIIEMKNIFNELQMKN